LIQTTIRYLAYPAATLILPSQLSGGMFTTVAGASLLVIPTGFAGQRFLTDILTGVCLPRQIPRGSRELAGDLIHSLLHERGDGLVVHGPVVTEVDAATARFQRATSLSRVGGPRNGS
jgi:hypothetical protein